MHLGLGVLALLTGAAGVTAHEGDGRVEVTPARVGPGEVVTLIATSLTSGSEVTIGLVTASGTVELGSATADDEGNVTAQVTIPADTAPRYYELHAVDASGLELVGYLEVTGSTTDSSATAPGAPGWAGWAVIGGLALIGTALAAVGRRRLRRGDEHRSRHG